GAANRWGDYSGMTVDQSDDCTFYYTTEYYTATGELCPTTTTTICWKTKIGAFKFPSCTAATFGTLTGIVTDAATPLTINGATVATSNGYVRVTAATGTYSMSLPPGTYTVTASAPAYAPSTATVT